jgi:hypothetical protein
MINMVEFNLTVNRKQRTAYINRKILDALGYDLVIVPNAHSGVLYAKNADKKDVIRSVEIILADLKLQVAVAERKTESFLNK